mgnify:CR=1 FL=1
MTTPRLFVLSREEDVSGISGTGIVADGVMFDEFVVLCWRKRPPQNIPSIVVYQNLRAVEQIHGHDGRTKIVWLWPLDAAEDSKEQP